MSFDISLSASVRQNLRALQQTTDMMATVQQRLATGKKVNSALDDPTAYFTAMGLNNRANDISVVLDGMSQSIQTLKTTSSSLDSIQKLLEQMKSVATSARNSASASQASASTTNTNSIGDGTALVGYEATGASAAVAAGNQLTIDVGSNKYTYTVQAGDTGADLKDWLNSISGVSAAYETDSDGVGHLKVTSTSGDTIAVDTANSTASLSALGLSTVSTAGTSTKSQSASSLTANTALNGLEMDGANAIATGDFYSVQVGSGPVQYFEVGTNGSTVGDLMDWLNGIEGVSAKFATDDNGVTQVQVSSENGQAITFGKTDSGGNANATAATTLGFGDLEAGATAYDGDGSLTKQYADLVKQVQKVVDDASYNGINLLKGQNLTVMLSENASSKLVVEGVQFDPLQSDAALKLTSTLDFNANGLSDVEAALEELSAAQAKVRSQQTSFGTNLATIQTRQDFAKTLVQHLREGADKLTLADMNEEGANMLALQTRNTLATQSLSMASQAAQNVLRLF